MHQLSATVQDVTASTFDGIEALAVVLVAITARAIHEEASGHGLTMLQWRAFMELAVRPLRLTQLAARLPASVPATSKLVARLIDHGLMSSEPDRADARALQIRLTPEGLELRERILRRRRAYIVAAVGPDALPPALDAGLHEIALRLQAATSR